MLLFQKNENKIDMPDMPDTAYELNINNKNLK